MFVDGVCGQLHTSLLAQFIGYFFQRKLRVFFHIAHQSLNHCRVLLTDRCAASFPRRPVTVTLTPSNVPVGRLDGKSVGCSGQLPVAASFEAVYVLYASEHHLVLAYIFLFEFQLLLHVSSRHGSLLDSFHPPLLPPISRSHLPFYYMCKIYLQ